MFLGGGVLRRDGGEPFLGRLCGLGVGSMLVRMLFGCGRSNERPYVRMWLGCWLGCYLVADARTYVPTGGVWLV